MASAPDHSGSLFWARWVGTRDSRTGPIGLPGRAGGLCGELAAAGEDDVHGQPDTPRGRRTPLDRPHHPDDAIDALTRRTRLRVAGGGFVAAGLAAGAPIAVGRLTWTYPPGARSGPALPAPSTASPSAPPAASPSASMSHEPSAAPSASAPAVDHANALAVVKRFLDGEGASMAGQRNVPLEPEDRRRGEGLRHDD